MIRSFNTVRIVLSITLSLLIGLLILQALGYGAGFALDPSSGVNEFGYDPPPIADDLTVGLVGLVGIGMLGSAALLLLSLVLVWRANPVGVYLAVIVGSLYLLAGVNAYRAEWWWDANFYGIAGALLVILSISVGWAQRRTIPNLDDGGDSVRMKRNG